MKDIQTLVQNQHDFFMKNNTKSVEFRRRQLLRLKTAILKYEDDILDALNSDLSKAHFEGYITEVSIVLEELDYMLKHLDKLSRPRTVHMPITQFPSVSYIYQEPYGVVLIMAPWNYPFQLSLVPLVGAIAAGNCAVVKPSNYSPAASHMIAKLLRGIFPPEYIAVIEGGREENSALLLQKFDYIFFTGGTTVGKTVMRAAAENLTPVTLELGGKSPCIIDETANISRAARRVAWGKFLNAGQTCVAPDYVLVHESVKERFLKALQKNIEKFYGTDPQLNPEYPKIITQRHFDRLCTLIREEPSVIGGRLNPEYLKIEPAILPDATWDSPAMQEEIFGPVLPVISYTDLNAELIRIKKRPRPLALYLFTGSKETRRKVLREVSFGGGCINDTIIHLASSGLPFGGVGDSGIGGYHGEASFRTFSHSKSVVKKGTAIDIPLRYPPFKNKLNIVKKFM